MRLRKDKSSWHASGVIARDARATKTPEPSPTPHKSRKDTKRWCKGIVGREHKAEWQENRRYPWGWYAFVCTACRKELDYCRPIKWSGGKDPCKCDHHT